MNPEIDTIIYLQKYSLDRNGEMFSVARRWGKITDFEKVRSGFLGGFAKGFSVVELDGFGDAMRFVLKYEPHAIISYEKYLHLRQAGVPVVDTFRLVNNDTIAETDLRAKGFVLFGKAMAIMMNRAVNREMYMQEAREYLQSIPAEYYDAFLAQTAESGEVECELQIYANRATHANIALPLKEEQFELAIGRGGERKFLMLDIGAVKLNVSYEMAKSHNSGVVEETIQDIQYMRDWLFSYRRNGVIEFPII